MKQNNGEVEFNNSELKDSFNRSEKQFNFNQIKGVISEMNPGEKFGNITIKAGHNNVREINLVIKNDSYAELVRGKSIGDKVSIKFYLSSRKREGKWNTMANILSMEKVDENFT